MRVVLDSNVLVSGFLSSKGPSAQILDRVRKNQIIWLLSDYILAEVFETLSHPRITRKYDIDPQSANNLKFLLGEKALLFPGLVVIETLCRDPKDSPILACAVEGMADFVVTGDKDLLCLEFFQGIPVVAPARFLEQNRF